MTVRILLAEDNENLAGLLARFIESKGFEAAIAATGTQAVKQLASGNFDLLLLDLGLPEISGVEILHKIRKSARFANLPVIIMTGIYKSEKHAQAATRLGVKHYLEKPFSREAFEAAIHDSLRATETAQEKPTLLATLLSIYNNRLSGLLAIGDLSPIAFVTGEPASFCARGKADFGGYLLAKGEISRADITDFINSDSGRLFFTEAGLLTFDDLQSEAHLYLVKLLTDNLQKTEGIYFSQEEVRYEAPLLTVSIPRLIYDATRQYPEQFHSAQLIARKAGLYPARTAAFYRRANLLTMSGADIVLLEKINGKTTVSELLAKSGGSSDPEAFINFLQLLGMVTLREAPGPEALPDFPLKTLFNRPLEESSPMEELTIDFDDLVEEVADNVVMAMGGDNMAAPLSSQEIGFEQAVQREYAQLKDKDYYTAFGMNPAKFSFNTLKEAYFSKVKEYSPERFMELSGATSAMAQEILSIYADAYNTLSNVVTKERYDEMLNDNKTMGIDGREDGQLHARIQFQSGKVFLDMGEYENAEKALQEAYTLEPDNSGHTAFLAWAIYNNSVNSKSKAALERARNLLTKSLQIEKSAEAFAFRGWMLYDEGRDGLAESEFLKALKINPRESVALKGMKLINEKRDGDKKGVFRRLFN
ncbi:MAG: response regulator [Deltaproteobacteria bacterium HGW-Deltaproteobacteria-23]|nr:MAG: response regulator [Deltaproteobacteria bacterium HGW-Deltaproteobacteria-23]